MPRSKGTNARDRTDLSPIMVLCVHKASQSLPLSSPEDPIEPLAPIVIQVLSEYSASHPRLRLQARHSLRQRRLGAPGPAQCCQLLVLEN